ncbi:Haloacetate dehalogenase H-2 [bacterium HR29]|nr:Haloacetate dehalogenase H-2 [bacterium HR29]
MPDDAAPRACVFDAFGTLFDVRSLRDACEAFFPGRGDALAQLWREKQLQYSWLRTLMGRYADFSRVTADALAASLAALGLGADGEQQEELLRAFARVEPFPEVRRVLESLEGYTRAIFTNGSPSMIADVVEHAGLAGMFERIISVDPARRFKPHPAAYGLVPAALGLPADRILFVSSNYWDAAGAKSYGFPSVWVNRTGAPPERLGIEPDHEVLSLDGLPAILGRSSL